MCASGDLVPLAHMTDLLVGLGYTRYQGERLPAGEALRRAGLAPAVLQSKEGLALVNGTSAMTGLAALATHEARRVLLWMERLTACLFQALNGEPEVLCEQAQKARGFRGQVLWGTGCAGAHHHNSVAHSFRVRAADRRTSMGLDAKAGRSRRRDSGPLFIAMRAANPGRFSGGVVARRASRHPRIECQHG